jgi:UDPglucose 6-dehydrogenase
MIVQSLNKKDFIVIIKSTIPPGTTERLNTLNKNINIVFNPEFLTEANAVEDYKNQNRIVIGGDRPYSSKVKTVFEKAFPKVPIVKTSSTIAEMIKYVTNTFLASKVSFANEMYQICQGLNIDYDKVIEYSRYDDRLGNSHWSVPGPDGDFGYGGHCFPKDVAALKYVANQLGVDTTVLDATIDKNTKVRTDKDWEKQVGRAVSND